MPILDFLCLNPNCGKEFTFFKHLSDEVPVCAYCSSTKVEKQVSKGTSFKLKGDNWSRDNYGNKPRK